MIFDRSNDPENHKKDTSQPTMPDAAKALAVELIDDQTLISSLRSGLFKEFFKSDHPIWPHLNGAVNDIQHQRYQDAWDKLANAQSFAIAEYNEHFPAKQTSTISPGTGDSTVDRWREPMEFIQKLQTVLSYRSLTSFERQPVVINQYLEVVEALDIVRRYGGGPPEMYDPQNMKQMQMLISEEYKARGLALTPDLLAHINRVMDKLEIVDGKPKIKRSVTVSFDQVLECGKPNSARFILIDECRSFIADVISVEDKDFTDYAIDLKLKRPNKINLPDLELISEVVRLGLNGQSFSSGLTNLINRLSVFFAPETLGPMIHMLYIDPDGIIRIDKNNRKLVLTNQTAISRWPASLK